jgi:hypothetical protein
VKNRIRVHTIGMRYAGGASERERRESVERLPGCQPNKAICHACRPNASHTLTHNLATKKEEAKGIQR